MGKKKHYPGTLDVPYIVILSMKSDIFKEKKIIYSDNKRIKLNTNK